MSAALHYIPEAYSIDGPKLMGRNAAGESFIRGYLKHTKPAETIWVYVDDQEHAKAFQLLAKEFGRQEKVSAIDKYSLQSTGSASVIFHPGPGIGEQAYLRRLYGDASWSICGITHTTSSARAMDSIVDLITAPVQPWDAIICPSEAVKKNVENILQAQVQYLRHRLGISRLVQPLFPVIPLGIHTADFKFSDTQRNGSRSELGVDQEDLIVLYMGRLSFHAKAHPLSMYQALEEAHRKTSRNIVLVECGWHANDFIKDAFTEAAGVACPSIKRIHLDGRLEKNRILAWSSADIFCSLSDNIQETFGIVPLEAMAAGLPVVVSDWDGYRDTVRNGIDGFRISTLAPRPGLKEDLSHRHALGIDSYDMYCGSSSSFVSVNLTELIDAFVQLIKSKNLRREMGEAGKERAKNFYDWRAVIPQYEELWENQAEIRQAFSAGRLKTGSQNTNKSYTVDQSLVWPARLDPSASFSHYATRLLDENVSLIFKGGDTQKSLSLLRTYRSLKMVNFVDHLLPNDEDVRRILQKAMDASPSPIYVSQLVADFDDKEKPLAIRYLAWLAKLGIFVPV
jgi:starch synthase